MDAAEHFDEVDAVECPFLDCEVEFFHPMLICARHRCERLSAAADLPTGGLRPQGEAGPDRRPRRWRLRDRVAVEALRRRRLSPDRQDPPGACPAGTHRASMAAQSFGVFHKDPIRRAPLHAECSRQRGGIGCFIRHSPRCLMHLWLSFSIARRWQEEGQKERTGMAPAPRLSSHFASSRLSSSRSKSAGSPAADDVKRCAALLL